MKKIGLGIAMILFGIVLYVLGEIEHISFFYNDLARLVYVILPFTGFGMSVWGFFDKDE